jgi:hypothetical protein
MNLVLWIFLATASVNKASALTLDGHENGNGGDIVLCGGSTPSAELLDFFEARVLRGITVKLGGADQSVEQKINLMIDRAAQFDSFRVEKLKKGLDFFWKNSQFVRGLEFVDVPDSGHIGLPPHCSIAQIAVQRLPPFPEEKYFIINQDLWDLLSNDGKAGLIMHEILFKEMLSLGQSNSKRARYFNSLLASDAFETGGAKRYREALKSSDLPFPFLFYSRSQWLFFVDRKLPPPNREHWWQCRLMGGDWVPFKDLKLHYPVLGTRLGMHGVLGDREEGSFAVNAEPKTWGGSASGYQWIEMKKDDANVRAVVTQPGEYPHGGVHSPAICQSNLLPDLEELSRHSFNQIELGN